MTDHKDAGPGERSVYDRIGMPHVFPSKCVVPLITLDGEMVGSAMGHDRGMTLRDWFAGQALAGILANPNIHKEADAVGIPCIDIAVPAAYIAADKMLEART